MFSPTKAAVTGNKRASFAAEGRATTTRCGSPEGAAVAVLRATRHSEHWSLGCPKEKAGSGFPQLMQLAILGLQLTYH
jgi:hypothetical protein